MLDGNECVVRFASKPTNGGPRRRYTCNVDEEIYNAISVHHKGRCNCQTKSLCETRGIMIQGDGEIPRDAHSIYATQAFPVRTTKSQIDDR
jgi:hypothetical protein